MINEKDKIIVLLAGAAVVAVVGYYIIKTSAGILSGDNALTRNQTDADGNKVTAYQGAGVAGTIGAAANSVSGGSLASIGESLGSWAFDAFGPKLNADNTGYVR